MNAKRIALAFGAAAMFAPCAFAQEAVPMEEAAALLKKSDDSTTYAGTDFAARYTIAQEKPGQGASSMTAIMYRRDSKASYTILITAPAKDKGKGYVQFDSNIWYFDPADRQFIFTSANDRFQGSNATTSDFTPQHYSRDYKIASALSARLGKFDCVLFELDATVDKVEYPHVKLWVTRDDGLIRKREDYSLSGQLLRTTAMPSYQIYKNRVVPGKILVVDNLRGKQINGKMQYEQTQVTITDVSFAKQKDATYTKKYVEMMSVK